MPLYVPLLGIMLLLLAATVLLPMERATPVMQPALVVASDTPDVASPRRASPFGSGTALRNLLY